METTRIMARLGDMKKAADFVVCPPREGSTTVVIKSATRICRFDPATGHGVLSATHNRGADTEHLHPARGAALIRVPREVIHACRESN